MKKSILIIFSCLLSISATAGSLGENPIILAKAVKLGRGNAYSVTAHAKISAWETGIDCHDQCKSCDTTTGTCSVCNTGYYLQNNICITCPANAQCDNGLDYVCANTFYKSRDECINICSNITCVDGTLPVASADKCCCPVNACPSICAECTDGECKKCNDGYLLSGSACISCPDNATCNGTHSYSCKAGTYRRQGYKCTKCPANSNPCDGKSSSFSCKKGYYLSNSSCVACPTGCSSCSSASSCSACSAGYYKSGSNCYQCKGSQSGGMSNASEICFKLSNGAYARAYVLLKCSKAGEQAQKLVGSAVFKSCICNTDGRSAKCTYTNENKTLTVTDVY